MLLQAHPAHTDAAAHARCGAVFPVAWRALRRRRERTVTYVCDRRLSPCGGLGDRMAGIIDVTAYALVTNRTQITKGQAPQYQRSKRTPVVRKVRSSLSPSF